MSCAPSEPPYPSDLYQYNTCKLKTSTYLDNVSRISTSTNLPSQISRKYNLYTRSNTHSSIRTFNIDPAPNSPSNQPSSPNPQFTALPSTSMCFTQPIYHVRCLHWHIRRTPCRHPHCKSTISIFPSANHHARCPECATLWTPVSTFRAVNYRSGSCAETDTSARADFPVHESGSESEGSMSPTSPRGGRR
jgi:hypothetical protein